MKTLIYKGQECEARRVNIYVKRGAYKHGYVKGWELYANDGEVVVSGSPRYTRSAYEYQRAEFPTFQALKDHVDAVNEHFANLEKRRARVDHA